MGRTRGGYPELAAAAVVALVLGNDDLLGEIFLCLDSPTWLVRAAAVCRRWLRVASGPAFLRRFRELHPPHILAFRLGDAGSGWVSVPQPRDLAGAARRALDTLRRFLVSDGFLLHPRRCHPYYSHVCDCRNGRLVSLVPKGDPALPTDYAVRSLLHQAPDIPLPRPRSRGRTPRTFQVSAHCQCRYLLLLEDDGDAASCVCLDLTFNRAQFCVHFSILQSGVWGVQRRATTELRQHLQKTMDAHKLLVGRKFYMMTTLGYILEFDLETGSFFDVQLPEEVRYSTTLKFSRARQSGLYLVDATGFELRVWHGEGDGYWVLKDSISVREACGHLNVHKWEQDDGLTAPVLVIAVGDNAEFLIMELVVSGVICCMQLSNKVVEEVASSWALNTSFPKLRVLDSSFVPSISMTWPPIFPVVDEANQEN